MRSWNFCTPTRGMASVRENLSQISADGPVKVIVARDALYFGKFPIFASRHVAKCLDQAGFESFELPKGISAADVNSLLRILSHSRLTNLHEATHQRYIIFENTSGDHPMVGVDFEKLHDDILPSFKSAVFKSIRLAAYTGLLLDLALCPLLGIRFDENTRFDGINLRKSLMGLTIGSSIALALGTVSLMIGLLSAAYSHLRFEGDYYSSLCFLGGNQDVSHKRAMHLGFQLMKYHVPKTFANYPYFRLGIKILECIACNAKTSPKDAARILLDQRVVPKKKVIDQEAFYYSEDVDDGPDWGGGTHAYHKEQRLARPEISHEEHDQEAIKKAYGFIKNKPLEIQTQIIRILARHDQRFADELSKQAAISG